MVSERAQRLLPEGGKVCIIGGGTSGLLAAKACLEENLVPTIFEQTSSVGGVWRLDDAPTRVAYESLYTNSSGSLMGISDFPIDQGLRDHFPRRQDICSYYEAYFKNFNLADHTQFKSEVLSVRRVDRDPSTEESWEVRVLQDGKETTFFFHAVFICTGQFRNPVHPEMPQVEKFKGRVTHSAAYRGPEKLRGRRLVVVGNGNSALDISLEAAKAGASSVVVLCRSGTNVIPVADYDGRPLDQMLNTRLFNKMPGIVRNLSFLQAVRGTNAAFQAHGMPAPKRSKGSAGFSNLKEHVLYRRYLDEGKIKFVKGAINSFGPDYVHLDSGEQLSADEVIYCTGYEMKFPVLDPVLHDELVVSSGGKRHLNAYKLVMHPTQPTLCVLAFVLTFGNESCVAEMQARWAVANWAGRTALPSGDHLRKDLQRRRKGGKYPQFVPYAAYMDELAAECGVSPSLALADFVRDPVLSWKLLTAPLVPSQYRMSGPSSWQNAADFVRSQPSTVKQWFRLFYAPPHSKGAVGAVPPSRL